MKRGAGCFDSRRRVNSTVGPLLLIETCASESSASKMPSMRDDLLRLDDAVAILERTPASLTALLKDLPERWVEAKEGAGTWSPYDVIGHLIHGERTDWIPRARHIMAGDTRPFEKFDRTAQFPENQGKSLGELLEIFADLRQENVAVLVGMNLTEGDLERKGLHPELG